MFLVMRSQEFPQVVFLVFFAAFVLIFQGVTWYMFHISIELIDSIVPFGDPPIWVNFVKVDQFT